MRAGWSTLAGPTAWRLPRTSGPAGCWTAADQAGQQHNSSTSLSQACSAWRNGRAGLERSGGRKGGCTSRCMEQATRGWAGCACARPHREAALPSNDSIPISYPWLHSSVLSRCIAQLGLDFLLLVVCFSRSEVVRACCPLHSSWSREAFSLVCVGCRLPWRCKAARGTLLVPALVGV